MFGSWWHRTSVALTALSLALFCAISLLWLQSYCAGPARRLVPHAGFRSAHSHGQVVLVYHCANRHPGWVWTTVHCVSGDPKGVEALVVAAVFDAGSPPDPVHPPFRSALLSRPYIPVTLARGRPFDGVAGFRVTRVYLPGWEHLGGVLTAVAVPYWSLWILTALLPVRWLWGRHVHRRRSHAGRCCSCGYDLRATPDRCPECGTVT